MQKHGLLSSQFNCQSKKWVQQQYFETETATMATTTVAHLVYLLFFFHYCFVGRFFLKFCWPLPWNHADSSEQWKEKFFFYLTFQSETETSAAAKNFWLSINNYVENGHVFSRFLWNLVKKQLRNAASHSFEISTCSFTSARHLPFWLAISALSSRAFTVF